MVHSEYRFDVSLKERKKSTVTLVRVAILQVDIGTCDLPHMKQGTKHWTEKLSLF